MDWKDIVYDIPLPRKQRKAALARAREGGQQSEEDGTTTTPTPPLPEGIAAPPPGFRRILNGIGGTVQRGEMVAILGASGAGKTTLLNVLSARLDHTGNLSGNVTFQGKARDPASWKRTVGFVEQDDLLISFLSVRETLDFAARLRLPNKLFNKKQKEARVDETMDVLRLEKVAETRIGNSEARGVSGGERKRVSIGCELVSDVSMLLLDEPTSGLDAFQAMNIMSNLKEIAVARNLACLATIHAPSWKVFSLFDRVILLARGGVYYSGPPKEAPAYFEGLGMPTPEGSNPADHFINIAENFDRTDASERRVLSLLTSWQEHESKLHTRSTEELSRATTESTKEVSSTADEKMTKSASRVSATDAGHISAYRQWPTSWFGEFLILCERKALQIKRNPITLIGTAGQTVVLCIIIGFAFFRLGLDQADVLARVGVLFFIPVNASFAVIFPILSIFPLQRALMRRERSSGLYRTSSFYLAQVMVEIPTQFCQRVLFYVLLFFMIGLRLSAASFFIYLAVNMVQVLTAITLGFAIGSMSPTIEIGQIIAPLINVIFLLFGSNALPNPPPWYIWLKYCSPIFYAYSALSLNEYRGLEFTCDPNATQQCYRTGEAVIANYHIGIFTIAESIGFLFAISFFWLVVGYVALRYLGHPRFRYL